METPRDLTVYTTSTCGQCWALKGWLRRRGIPFAEVDVERDADARQFVRRVANGFTSVPTVVFPDGRVLVEPSHREVEAALAG